MTSKLIPPAAPAPVALDQLSTVLGGLGPKVGQRSVSAYGRDGSSYATSRPSTTAA